LKTVSFSFTVGSLEFLLDEPRAVLIAAEFDQVTEHFLTILVANAYSIVWVTYLELPASVAFAARLELGPKAGSVHHPLDPPVGRAALQPAVNTIPVAMPGMDIGGGGGSGYCAAYGLNLCWWGFISVG